MLYQAIVINDGVDVLIRSISLQINAQWSSSIKTMKYAIRKTRLEQSESYRVQARAVQILIEVTLITLIKFHI